MSYDEFKDNYLHENTFWSENPATKRIGRLSAKVATQDNICLAMSQLNSLKFRQFAQENDQCERALKDLFLPQDLAKFISHEKSHQPIHE